MEQGKGVRPQERRKINSGHVHHVLKQEVGTNAVSNAQTRGRVRRGLQYIIYSGVSSAGEGVKGKERSSPVYISRV